MEMDKVVQFQLDDERKFGDHPKTLYVLTEQGKIFVCLDGKWVKHWLPPGCEPPEVPGTSS